MGNYNGFLLIINKVLDTSIRLIIREDTEFKKNKNTYFILH